MIFTLPASSRACIRYPSSLISCSQSGPSGAFFTSAASCGFTQLGGDPRSPLGQAGGAVALEDDLAIATVHQSLPPPVGTEAPGFCDIQAPSTCGGMHHDGRGEPDRGDRRVHRKSQGHHRPGLIGDYIAGGSWGLADRQHRRRRLPHVGERHHRCGRG
jgi:hypothetical protein